MNISRLSSTNFGKFIDYNTWDNVTLTRDDENILRTVISVMDKVEGSGLDFFARIGKPNNSEPERLYVKFKTLPTLADFKILKSYKPNITQEAYKRHSKWFPIDESLMFKAYEYLHKQNGYLHYCKKNPDYITLTKSGYEKPKF